ncbi:MAG TPA: 30S ribosome-binding factor RbfA [Acidobacteriota bacterium]|nr:30S ribosome-binding factor RbfA [Acidobacteriota bacterium]
MQPSRRPKRLALQIQHEISSMLSRDLKDKRVGFVTVTGVQMTPDLRHAKIFVSSMGSDNEKKESLDALKYASGWIRHELGRRIRIKYLPEISFFADTSQDYGDHIDNLIQKIHDHDHDQD